MCSCQLAKDDSGEKKLEHQMQQRTHTGEKPFKCDAYDYTTITMLIS